MDSGLEVGIIIDEKCNIECAHCCFSSGPKSTQHLDDDDILRIARESVDSPTVTTVGISGGEAMLRKSVVLETIQIVSQGKKSVSLTTNGFWGVTPKKATQTANELKDAGPSHLTISYDGFHSDLLKPQRVANVLDAAKSINLPVSINIAVTSQDNGDHAVSLLQESADDVPLRRFSVTPVGKAKSLTQDDFIRKTYAPDTLRCPGFEPTFHFDGKVYPCCSPIVFDTCLQVGSVENTSVDDSIDRISRNAYFAIIRREGFGWLHKRAVEERILDKEGSESVVDACELCARLTKNEEFLSTIAPELVARASSLPPLTGADMSTSASSPM